MVFKGPNLGVDVVPWFLLPLVLLGGPLVGIVGFVRLHLVAQGGGAKVIGVDKRPEETEERVSHQRRGFFLADDAHADIVPQKRHAVEQCVASCAPLHRRVSRDALPPVAAETESGLKGEHWMERVRARLYMIYHKKRASVEKRCRNSQRWFSGL